MSRESVAQKFLGVVLTLEIAMYLAKLEKRNPNNALRNCCRNMSKTVTNPKIVMVLHNIVKSKSPTKLLKEIIEKL